MLNQPVIRFFLVLVVVLDAVAIISSTSARTTTRTI
jgi:hypothetical protein